MKKWCIKVTEENMPMVGRWFSKNSQNGLYGFNNKTFINEYLHFPCFGYKNRHSSCQIEEYYTEITFEQFKEQILKEPNKLQDILDKIKAIAHYNDYDDKIVNYKDIEQIFAEYGVPKTENNF